MARYGLWEPARCLMRDHNSIEVFTSAMSHQPWPVICLLFGLPWLFILGDYDHKTLASFEMNTGIQEPQSYDRTIKEHWSPSVQEHFLSREVACRTTTFALHNPSLHLEP